jgi:hypothetical protein
LNQTSVEYKNSNYTGAEELAIVAYLDNFEYVESELEKKGSHTLMQDIEHMMREEIRALIKNKANEIRTRYAYQRHRCQTIRSNKSVKRV